MDFLNIVTYIIYYNKITTGQGHRTSLLNGCAFFNFTIMQSREHLSATPTFDFIAMVFEIPGGVFAPSAPPLVTAMQGSYKI
jgi:hypothetical protein